MLLETPYILSLPPEILSKILSQLDPRDISQFAQSCSIARSFVYGSNDILWKQIYMNRFDTKNKHEFFPSWRDAVIKPFEAAKTVQRYSKFFLSGNNTQNNGLDTDEFEEGDDDDEEEEERFDHRYQGSNINSDIDVEDGSIGDTNDESDLHIAHVKTRHESEFEFALQILLDFLLVSDPRASESKNVLFLDVLFTNPSVQSIVFHAISTRNENDWFLNCHRKRLVKTSLQSRFHALFGPTLFDHASDECISEFKALVYSIRNFGEFNNWGPYTRQNAINWKIVEAAATLMQINYYHVGGEESGFGFGLGLQYSRPFQIIGGKDWAGLTSVDYFGSYAFLHYPAFYAYNYLEHNNAMLRNQDQTISTGLYMHIENVTSQDGIQPIDSEKCPTLYFTGRSRVTEIRGTISCKEEKIPRWSIIVSSNGVDEWMLEGVQIGGIRSASGIFGIWTSVDHEPDSPCGPFGLFPKIVKY